MPERNTLNHSEIQSQIKEEIAHEGLDPLSFVEIKQYVTRKGNLRCKLNINEQGRKLTKSIYSTYFNHQDPHPDTLPESFRQLPDQGISSIQRSLFALNSQEPLTSKQEIALRNRAMKHLVMSISAHKRVRENGRFSSNKPTTKEPFILARNPRVLDIDKNLPNFETPVSSAPVKEQLVINYTDNSHPLVASVRNVTIKTESRYSKVMQSLTDTLSDLTKFSPRRFFNKSTLIRTAIIAISLTGSALSNSIYTFITSETHSSKGINYTLPSNIATIDNNNETKMLENAKPAEPNIDKISSPRQASELIRKLPQPNSIIIKTQPLIIPRIEVSNSVKSVTQEVQKETPVTELADGDYLGAGDVFQLNTDGSFTVTHPNGEKVIHSYDSLPKGLKVNSDGSITLPNGNKIVYGKADKKFIVLPPDQTTDSLPKEPDLSLIPDPVIPAEEQFVINTGFSKKDLHKQASLVEKNNPENKLTYIVKKGDTLRRIAQEFLGDEMRWGEIYEANKDIIGKNPDLILPTQLFIIPGQ